MSDNRFPTGPWTGFYTYSVRPRRYAMDLLLEFKNGAMTGEGNDGVGAFVISGKYSEASGECSWNKQYVGRHGVDYKGYRDGKGIWGSWSMPGAQGGFHIWPLLPGELAEAEKESEPAERPVFITE